jgi:hypothetical protein
VIELWQLGQFGRRERERKTGPGQELMSKRNNKQCARAGLFGALFVASICAGRTDELASITIVPQPAQVVSLTQGFSNTIRVARPFSTIHITNPDIVDIVVTTDRTATLVPKAVGATNVDFFDDKSMLISAVNVVVNADEIPGQVRVFDHQALTSNTSYHCGPNICRYFEETITKEQPPITETKSVERIIHDDRPPR